jgi:anti-sigma factor RsiW
VRSSSEHYTEDRILAYLSGELVETEAVQVREHLQTCGECQRVSRELRALQRLLDSDVTPEPLGPVWPAVRARIQPTIRQPHRWRWVMATATAAAVGVLIGLSVRTKAPPAQSDLGYPLWSAVSSSLSSDRSIVSDVYGEPSFEGAPR